MNLAGKERRLKLALLKFEQRGLLKKPVQKHKFILYDSITRETIFETPDEQLAPLRPGEQRVVLMLPRNGRDDSAIAQGYRG